MRILAVVLLCVGCMGAVWAQDEAPAESTAEAQPWRGYIGYDYVPVRLSISNENTSATTVPAGSLQARFGGTSFSGQFHRVRGGVRLLEWIGLEAQLGFKAKGDGPGTAAVKRHLGFYAVPTGTLFETLEIAAPLGYAMMKFERNNADETFSAFSYGLNIELPIRTVLEGWPDLRIGGGGMVYAQRSTASIYGYHFGIRYDFKM